MDQELVRTSLKQIFQIMNAFQGSFKKKVRNWRNLLGLSPPMQWLVTLELIHLSLLRNILAWNPQK